MPMVLVKSDAKAREKPCLRCGYSLRNLGDAKHCPECGLSVWVSLNGNDTLDWSNPHWLKKLSVGTALLGISQLLGLAAYVLFITRFGRGGPRDAFLAIIVAGYLAGYSIGLLCLGSPEDRYPDWWKTHRRSAQALGAIGVLTSFAIVISSSGRFGWRPLGDGSLWDYATVFIVSAGVFSTWSYLAKLAKRIPSMATARGCNYLALFQIVWLVGLLQWVGCFNRTEATWMIERSPLIYLPLTTLFLIRFSFLFHRAANSAGANWKSETAKGA